MRAVFDLARKLFAALAALATVAWLASIVFSKHHDAVTFWLVIALGLLALTFFLLWLDARGAARSLGERLDAANSRDAVAARLDVFARDFDAPRDEIPSDKETGGQPAIGIGSGWGESVRHLQEDVKRELRRNAPGFLQYWQSDPEALPPEFPFEAWAQAHVDESVRQLRLIAARLRQGHDSP